MCQILPYKSYSNRPRLMGDRKISLGRRSECNFHNVRRPPSVAPESFGPHATKSTLHALVAQRLIYRAVLPSGLLICLLIALLTRWSLILCVRSPLLPQSICTIHHDASSPEHRTGLTQVLKLLTPSCRCSLILRFPAMFYFATFLLLLIVVSS
jgi:hypothetical protein